MDNIVSSTEISSIAIDFSLLALFMRADLIVKSVIIILILASIFSPLLLLCFMRVGVVEMDFFPEKRSDAGFYFSSGPKVLDRRDPRRGLPVYRLGPKI